MAAAQRRIGTASDRDVAGLTLCPVPDNQDYAALARLLGSPQTWSAQEAAVARSHLWHQEDAVASVHPKDEPRRESMQEVADDLRAAIATWERHNS